MKANPHRIVSPFFVPRTPIVAFDSGRRNGTCPLSLGVRHLRGHFRLENLSDRFRTAPGALTQADPRIFARVEARNRARFIRDTRLGRTKA